MGLHCLTLSCFHCSYTRTPCCLMLTDIWRHYRSDLICRHKFRMWVLSLTWKKNHLWEILWYDFMHLCISSSITKNVYLKVPVDLNAQDVDGSGVREAWISLHKPPICATFTEILGIRNPSSHCPSVLGSLLFSRTSLGRNHVESIKVCLLFFGYRQLNLPY